LNHAVRRKGRVAIAARSTPKNRLPVNGVILARHSHLFKDDSRFEGESWRSLPSAPDRSAQELLPATCRITACVVGTMK